MSMLMRCGARYDSRALTSNPGQFRAAKQREVSRAGVGSMTGARTCHG